MSIVLRNHIEASERSADQIEDELRRDHRWAMLCRDVEDLLADLADLFGRVNRHVLDWQDSLAKAPPPDPMLLESGSDWDGLYRKLESTFRKSAGLVQKLEGEGFDIDGTTAFEAAWKELRAITSFSPERVKAGVDQVRRGDVVPLGEVRNELWNLTVG